CRVARGASPAAQPPKHDEVAPQAETVRLQSGPPVRSRRRGVLLDRQELRRAARCRRMPRTLSQDRAGAPSKNVAAATAPAIGNFPQIRSRYARTFTTAAATSPSAASGPPVT